MEGATPNVMPVESLPLAHVGRTKPDTQQICADVAEPVQTPCETHWEPDGPGHLLHDTHIRLAGPGHNASDLGPGRATSDAPNLRAGSEETEVGQASIDAHEYRADLDLLHAALGHYARQLLDVQKVRVAMANRVAAMERDGLPAEWAAPARASMEDLTRVERSINSYLERSAKRHPMADWIRGQRGIGLPGFARLLGITGPLDRFATVSKLWAYLGMHVIDGAAPKRQKGERANWSPAGRVLCHQIAESIVKVGAGGPYRAAYDRKKAVYETDRPEWTQARRHNAAMRYAVKELLKVMWIEWRRCPGLSAAIAAGIEGES